jgi:hypothetical protein
MHDEHGAPGHPRLDAATRRTLQDDHDLSLVVQGSADKPNQPPRGSRAVAPPAVGA